MFFLWVFWGNNNNKNKNKNNDNNNNNNQKNDNKNEDNNNKTTTTTTKTKQQQQETTNNKIKDTTTTRTTTKKNKKQQPTTTKTRAIVPWLCLGRPLFRARQFHAHPVREQQHEVLYQQNTLIQQVVHFEYDPELRHLVQGNDASIEQIIQEIMQIKRAMGQMSQALTEAFAGVRGDAQNQNKNLHDLASQMVLSQTRLQEIAAEITRVSRSELEPLKERCRKAEFEIVSLLRQEAQEGANRVPELERELKIAKERIEKLELRGVQTTEVHQQLMSQLGERIARLETQPQPASQLPISGNSATNSLKEEQGKRIQELQIWVQALNGGTSALVDPRSWENPLLGIQAEQKTQKAHWEELNQLYNTIRESVSWTPKGSRKTARKGW